MSTAPGNPGSSDADASRVADRKILLGVTGGIACYKAAALVSQLVQHGAQVRVAMTESATRFVGPITFQSLSGQPVQTSIWEADDRPDAQHIALSRWCDVFVIAPATANCLAKLAAGLCDDPVTLSAAALPRTTPALIAPAMNADMWANPVNQRNLTTIRETLGWTIIDPEEGWQACRTKGAGRMAEAETIAARVSHVLSK